MKSKTFIKTTVSIFLAVLIVMAGFQVAIDPLFQYHTPWFGLKPHFIEERYQNAGTARNFEFDTVLMGNSYCENFIISDINKKFDGKTAKLTLAGSNPVDWVYLLDILKKRETCPKLIICCIDPYRLTHSITESKIFLPKYLYDENYINDVNYLFNFQIVNDYSYDMIESNIQNDIPDYDDVYRWGYEGNKSGKELVLKNYKRPQKSDEEVSAEKYSNAAMNAVGLLQPFFEAMPDTQFVYFFPPFSMLFWDSCRLQNTTAAYISAMKTGIEILNNYDNVSVFLWTDDEMFSIMSDLDNYIDTLHYQKYVNSLLLERMSKKEGLITKENYIERINRLSDYVNSFDYNLLF